MTEEWFVAQFPGAGELRDGQHLHDFAGGFRDGAVRCAEVDTDNGAG